MAASAASGRMFYRVLLAARTFATTSGRVSGIQSFSQFPVFKQGEKLSGVQEIWCAVLKCSTTVA